MADEPTNQQPISDDQELAKVLAGVNNQVDSDVPEPAAVVTDDDSAATTEPALPQMPEVETDATPTFSTPTPSAGSDDLDSIKVEALSELRPLVDKLNVAPEEKFDTYLLLLRSTDDRALIEPAHEAAKGIVDEARRAQALLDIIKEIDFLSQSQK